ncbi:MAG: hypothetical protein ACI8QS_000191 [Planctomycetota bacterium]|jgi:hypothetical protein
MDPLEYTDLDREDALEHLTQRVIERALGGEADQGLMDAAQSLGAGAVSIWRPLENDKGFEWRPVRARGDPSLLPPDSVAESYFEGLLSFGLPSGTMVAGGKRHGIGMVLGDIHAPNCPSESIEEPPLYGHDREDWARDCENLLESIILLVTDICGADLLTEGVDGLPGLLPGETGPQTDDDGGWPEAA